MFADGLVERGHEDIDAPLARLVGLRLPPGADVAGAVDFVLTRLDAQHAEDDVAVLAVRLPGAPPP